MWTTRTVLLTALVVRVAGALLNSTFFNPDEWWQGPEVAHRLVFGYGATTWEWEPDAQLRGYFHPMALFAWPFLLAKWLGCDTPLVVQWLPRLVQAVLAALTDVAVFVLCTRLDFPEPPPSSSASHSAWRSSVVNAVMTLQLSSWFLNYCLVRTYSNSAETCASLLALAVWPASHPSLPWRSWAYAPALALAALSVLLRPTAVLFWLPVAGYELLSLATSPQRAWALRRLLALAGTALLLGALALALGCAVDRLGYGQWTLVPLNFVRFNVLQNLAGFYGTHPWHWYFSNAAPTMLLAAVPLLGAGVYGYVRHSSARRDPQQLPLGLVVWLLLVVVGGYSLLGHKEFRFVLPALPLAFIVAGYGAALLAPRLGRRRLRLATAALLLSNAAAFGYFALAHQRGVMDLVQHVRDEPAVQSIHFLMPCHSTPLYSHIHRPIATRTLQCRPPLPGQPHYDEADDFFARPAAFLHDSYSPAGLPLPSHFALFAPVLPHVQPFLDKHGYHLAATFWHTFTPVDSRHGDVLLFARSHQ